MSIQVTGPPFVVMWGEARELPGATLVMTAPMITMRLTPSPPRRPTPLETPNSLPISPEKRISSTSRARARCWGEGAGAPWRLGEGPGTAAAVDEEEEEEEEEEEKKFRLWRSVERTEGGGTVEVALPDPAPSEAPPSPPPPPAAAPLASMYPERKVDTMSYAGRKKGWWWGVRERGLGEWCAPYRGSGRGGRSNACCCPRKKEPLGEDAFSRTSRGWCTSLSVIVYTIRPFLGTINTSSPRFRIASMYSNFSGVS